MRARERLWDSPSVAVVAAAAYLLQLPLAMVAGVPVAILAVRSMAGLLLDGSPELPAQAVEPAPPAARGLLSRRELEVAPLIAEGLTNREIAGRLHIEESTVDSHVDHIKNKLGFDHKTQIAAWWVKTGSTS